MQLWGKSWSKSELMARVGSLSQLGGVTRFEYSDGKAKGVTGLRLRTAAGLDFTVSPDKGMDIVEASYKGRSLCWISPVGVAHPSFYDRRDIQFLRTFPGGLLTTCGLTTAGLPCEDEGDTLGLHGSISNTPAEQVSWREEWEGDELRITIKGRVRESSVFGPNLVMNRTIRTSLDSCSIAVHDVVTNEGPEPAPLMFIYHLNFGFPLLSDRSRIYTKSANVEGRAELAKSHIADWNVFEGPKSDTRERVYYHAMQADEDGNVTVLLLSDASCRDLCIQLSYPIEDLPQFIEWKLPQTNHFVLGLEPSNCRIEGRNTERQTGRLQWLAPGEGKKFSLQLSVLDGKDTVSAAIGKFSDEFQ